jgi:hypothetical protein
MTDLTAAQMTERLRTFRKHYSPIALYVLMDDVADLIEQQAEQIAELTAEVATAWDEGYDAGSGGDYHDLGYNPYRVEHK